MAQQASPIGMGISELERAQLSKASTRVVKKPCPLLEEDPAIGLSGNSKKMPVGEPVRRHAMSEDAATLR
jgi:hypothetical protein